MPYIEKGSRVKYTILRGYLHTVPRIETKGDLEYLIFLLMKKYMETRENRYTTLHDCVYAAIHAGEEFKRRFLDVREEQALKKNGDVKL